MFRSLKQLKVVLKKGEVLSPVVVVSVVGAEHHAIVNRHGAVFTVELQRSVQETVTSSTGVAVHC